MKDVAYFIGSCLQSEQSEVFESKILDFYFSELTKFLKDSDIDVQKLEYEWRNMYHLAWADFQRFLLGWSPHHRKLNNYSQRCTELVSEQILTEIQDTVARACKEAGKFIFQNWKEQSQREVLFKGSVEVRPLTLLPILIYKLKEIRNPEPLIIKYELGVLAEEGHHNNRLKNMALIHWRYPPFVEGNLAATR